jgi:hypothetical protein
MPKKTLLYNNKVYESEVKFEDRIRFREDDFNFDIFSLILDFLEPKGRFYV